jgi:hypothetical protein
MPPAIYGRVGAGGMPAARRVSVGWRFAWGVVLLGVRIAGQRVRGEV